MDFSAEQNVRVPSEFAFRKATDHAFFARLARDRGVAMEPLVPFTRLAEGCGWRVAGTIRDRQIDCDLVIDEFDPGKAFAIRTHYRGADLFLAVEFESLGGRGSRLYADLSVEARTLPARLALKAASLTRGRLEKRFRRSVRRAALWLEAEHAAETGA